MRVTEGGTTNLKVFGGDIFHGILDMHKAMKVSPSPTSGFSQTWYFPAQSNYNIDLRRGYKTNSDLNSQGAAADITDEYFYDLGYSMENTLNTFIPKPANFNETNDFYNRIYWSDVKINGEPLDSWAVIPVNNNKDLDGNYGNINSLVTLGSNMFAIQENALAQLLINPTSLITTTNNVPVNLGNGGVLDKYNYISIDSGTKHRWSVSKSPNYITYLDIKKNKLVLFNGQTINPISDTKGARGFLNKILHDEIIYKDNPILGTGVLTTYDYTNNEFLFTFRNNALIPGSLQGVRDTTVSERYRNSS